MKISFSAFPDGLAGGALLLLRASVMLSLADAKIASPFGDGRGAFLFFLLAAMIGTGFFARATGALSVIVFMMLASAADQTDLLSFLVHALDAAALTLIGPGAYSLDAQRFGRQTFRLPR